MQKEDNNMTAMNEVNTVNERNMDMEGKAVKEKRTYTVKEIQEILDVSKPTVYALKSFDAWLDGIELGPE